MKTAADWQRWFRQWLIKHPLKQPPEFLGRNYTEEVLIRIKSRPSPSPAWGWLERPRFSFALGTVMACVLGMLVLIHSSDREEADLVETLDLIEEVEPNQLLSLGEDSLSEEDLLEELQLLDLFDESDLPSA